MSGTKSWSVRDFIREVIDPAIAALPLDETKGETVAGLQQLLIGTALQESDLIHTRQMGGGPARGYFQMEPATHDDIWANYLAYQKDTAAKVLAVAGLASGTPKAALLEDNHVYAALMARVHYRRRSKAKLPAADDVKAMAALWKQVYNTPKGKGKAEEFEAKYNAAMKK
jgi:hypothetical protein